MPSFTFHSRFRTHTSNAMSNANTPVIVAPATATSNGVQSILAPHFLAVSAMVIEAPDSRHRQLSADFARYSTSTSTTISTSTGARRGRPTMPTAERAWRPWSP